MKSTLLFIAAASASKLNPQALHNVLAQTQFYHDEEGNTVSMNLASDILDIARIIGADPEFWGTSGEEGHESAWNFLNSLDDRLKSIGQNVDGMD